MRYLCFQWIAQLVVVVVLNPLLGRMNIEVEGSVTEQFLCLVEVVHWNLVVLSAVERVIEVQYLGTIMLDVTMQVGLGWVSMGEDGLD